MQLCSSLTSKDKNSALGGEDFLISLVWLQDLSNKIYLSGTSPPEFTKMAGWNIHHEWVDEFPIEKLGMLQQAMWLFLGRYFPFLFLLLANAWRIIPGLGYVVHNQGAQDVVVLRIGQRRTRTPNGWKNMGGRSDHHLLHPGVPSRVCQNHLKQP